MVRICHRPWLRNYRSWYGYGSAGWLESLSDMPIATPHNQTQAGEAGEGMI